MSYFNVDLSGRQPNVDSDQKIYWNPSIRIKRN